MTLTGKLNIGRLLPPAHGGCTCACHRVPGIMHVAPCCRPAPPPPVTK